MEKQLGRQLVESGLISEEQLQTALEYQAAIGGKLGKLLVKLGFLADTKLAQFLADQQSVRFVDLSEIEIPQELLLLLPRDTMEKHLLVPIERKGNVLTVAMADPTDVDVIQTIEFMTGCTVAEAIAPRTTVVETINNFLYHEGRLPHREAAEVTPQSADGTTASPADQLAALPPNILAASLARLLIAQGVVDEGELLDLCSQAMTPDDEDN